MAGIPDSLLEALAHRYPLERELGRGGMATVYLARDLKHDRPVAVKVLRSEYASGLGADRFLREIKIAAGLTHPHILPLHDSGEAGGFLYYVMPYVPGESLRDRLRREKQLPIDEAIEIARQVADALDYAHQQGIVHRDIKPGNVLIVEGKAVVADFGVARAVTAAVTEPLTAHGIVVGTPQYMSPEQGSGERDLDGRSDVYALGCVLYELLTGEPPFSGRSPQAVIARHITEPSPSLQALRPSVPAWLERVVHTALAKAPADRFETAKAFSYALTSRGLAGSGLRRLAYTLRQRRVAIGLAAAAIIAAVAVLTRAPGGAGPDIQVAAAFPLTHIAVLHFDDLSEGRQLDSFAGRLTDHLIHELAQTEALTVLSRTAVEPYHYANVPLDSIVREHAVGAIVEGSVTGRAADVRITAQLIDGATLKHIGSQVVLTKHEDPDTLVIKAGDEVADLLRDWLATEIRLRERRVGTESSSAWDLVERAKKHSDDAVYLRSAGNTGAAVLAFQRADSLLSEAESADPKWAWPIIQRADVAYQRAREFGPAGRGYDPSWLRVGLGHAERALILQPDDPAALERRGTLRDHLAARSKDPSEADKLRHEAERDLLKAADLDSTGAVAWSRLSRIYDNQGRFEEAKLAAEHAYERGVADLVDTRTILFRLCVMSLELKQWDEVTRWCGEGRRRFPERESFVGVELVALAGPEGPEPNVSKAWTLADQFLELSAERHRAARRPMVLMQVAGVLARAGRADSARAIVAEARAIDSYHDPLTDYYEANVWLQFGDTERALELLSAYIEARPAEKKYLGGDWWWERLHAEPRFQQLVRPAE